MKTVKLTPLFAALLAVGIGLTGCSALPGISSNDKSDVKTSDEGSKESAQSSAGQPLTKDNFTERTTAAQMKAGSVRQTQVSEIGGVSTTTVIDMTLSENAKEMVMSSTTEMAGTGTTEMRMVDGVMYMNMGALSNDKFVKYGDGTDEKSLLDSLGGSDLAGQLKGYKDAMTGFSVKNNAEKVDGASMHRVVFTVDTSKILGDSAQGGAEESAGLGDGTVKMDMLVGDDDLPRRMTMTIGKVTTVTDYTRWGEPVSVVAPSADQITEMPGL